MTDNIKEFKGYNGTLVLTNTGIIIKRGVKGFLLGGGKIRGDKSIPFQSIVAVQCKKAGLTAGYLQLTLKGGSDAKGGVIESAFDENSINFYHNQNKNFEEAKSLIEQRINGDSVKNNNLNDLEKLAELKEKGIISQEEFDTKKKQILSL